MSLIKTGFHSVIDDSPALPQQFNSKRTRDGPQHHGLWFQNHHHSFRNGCQSASAQGRRGCARCIGLARAGVPRIHTGVGRPCAGSMSEHRGALRGNRHTPFLPSASPGGGGGPHKSISQKNFRGLRRNPYMGLWPQTHPPPTHPRPAQKKFRAKHRKLFWVLKRAPKSGFYTLLFLKLVPKFHPMRRQVLKKIFLVHGGFWFWEPPRSERGEVVWTPSPQEAQEGG